MTTNGNKPSTTNEAAERFKALTEKLLAVPKKELQEREKEYKAKRPKVKSRSQIKQRKLKVGTN